jgi:hypothetical protein
VKSFRKLYLRPFEISFTTGDPAGLSAITVKGLIAFAVVPFSLKRVVHSVALFQSVNGSVLCFPKKILTISERTIVGLHFENLTSGSSVSQLFGHTTVAIILNFLKIKH